MGGTRNYTARSGQQITGNLFRGTGGRFTSGGNSSSSPSKSGSKALPSVFSKGSTIPDKYLDSLVALTSKKTAGSVGKDVLDLLRNSLLLSKTNRLNALGRALAKARIAGDATELKRLMALALDNLLKRSGKERRSTRRSSASQQPKATPRSRTLGGKRSESASMEGDGLMKKNKGAGTFLPLEEIAVDEPDIQETELPPPGDMTLAEYWDYYGSGAKSFADLIAAKKADEASYQIRELCYQFPMLVSNIVNDPSITDKGARVRKLSGEFSDLVDGILTEIGSTSTPPTEEAVQEIREEAIETPGHDFTEVELLTEGDAGASADTNPRTVAYVDVEVIQPGWGNKRDNNHYPAEVLKRDAGVFVGAKMYETDHRQEEKSTRTWVSTVKELIGFSPKGAPVVRVGIHDPGFATKVRNLNELGLLDKMECSIFGQGKATANYEEGGRKGKRVDQLIEISSVDWVTRAGAGGKVVGLVESQDGGNPMEPKDTMKPEDVQEVTPPASEPETPVREGSQEVVIRESETPKVEKARVVELLAGSTLPKASQDRLAEQSFETEDAVQTAITSEIAYVKALTGSGRPAGLGESLTSPKKVVDQQAIDQRHREINEKYLGPVRR